MKRFGKNRKALLILGILLLLTAAGMLWQRLSTEAEGKRLAPVGEFLDTGTYSMHYLSKGEGDLAVVFIPGSGTPCAYTDFYRLQEALSDSVQTITFDHAGCGWSSSATEPRTTENLAAELKTLIDTAAGGKKILLVSHSMGAVEAIAYAQRYPGTVVGIVFLDGGSPEFYSRDSELSAEALNRTIALLRVTGLNRLLFRMGVTLPLYGENLRNPQLPSEQAQIDGAMFLAYSGSGDTLRNLSLMNENAASVLAGSRPGSLPILVLSSDSGSDWAVVQEQLAGWSENSEQHTISGSSHYLHWSNPDETEAAIRGFIRRISD